MALPDDEPTLEYDNLTGRPTGPVVRALSTVLSGVAEVQRQVVPYAAAWRAANLEVVRAAEPSAHPRWIALGDSMTQGIGASAFDAGWVNQVARRLPGEVDIVNLSASGARVEDVLTQQLPAWRRLAPSPGGEIMSVLIGSNDVMSLRHRNLVAEAYAELLEALPAGAVVSTLPSPARQARQANALVLEAARAGRIRPVLTERFGPGDWRGRLAADNFHPNDAGYQMIAELFLPVVAEALSALTPNA